MKKFSFYSVAAIRKNASVKSPFPLKKSLADVIDFLLLAGF